MAQAMINFRMDEELKKDMEETCKDLGLSMTTAFTIFAKKMTREKRIPFEVSVDPFYSESNMAYLKKVVEDIESGKEVLVKKYESQLDQKKKTIKNSYVKKVNEIDTQMNNAITQKSKAMGYDLVLKKDSVLFGGTDITKDIIPLIK